MTRRTALCFEPQGCLTCSRNEMPLYYPIEVVAPMTLCYVTHRRTRAARRGASTSAVLHHAASRAFERTATARRWVPSDGPAHGVNLSNSSSLRSSQHRTREASQRRPQGASQRQNTLSQQSPPGRAPTSISRQGSHPRRGVHMHRHADVHSNPVEPASRFRGGRRVRSAGEGEL